MLTPSQFNEISAADSLNLLQNQSANLNFATCAGLGPNIPKNTSFAQVAQAACCINFDIIKNAGPNVVASQFSSMNLPFVPPNVKASMSFMVIQIRLFKYNAKG